MTNAQEFINTLPSKKLFCWSFALKMLNIIERDYTDFDIILDISEYNNWINKDIEQMKWKYPFENNNKMKIISYLFKDNSKVDLFFREDFGKLKTIYTLDWDDFLTSVPYNLLHPVEIMYEKVNLIRQHKDIQKHCKDINLILKWILKQDNF